ncbi:MAG: tetratricopeptide repeat protein, partial [Segetibacter sp.]|nr:tetratricopeptide repeat protein [Segetibacter sp.]
SKQKEKIIAAYLQLTDQLSTMHFDEAISFVDDGLKVASSTNDSVSIAELLSNKGRAYYFKGRYDSAAKLYYAAISILEKENEPARLANAYNNIAKLYRKTHDLKRASEKYEVALQLFQSIKDSGGISMIYNESGVVYEYKEDYIEAIRRYEASLAICEKRNDLIGIAYALDNLAGIYTILKQFNKAERNLTKALNIQKQLKDSFALALNYSDLGSMYLAKGNYTKASESLAESNNIASPIKYLELLSNNFSQLAGIAKKQGNYQQAYEYQLKHASLKDSIFKSESQKEIEELSTRYETNKKEQRIKIQSFQIQKRNIWICIMIGFILAAGFVSWLVYNRHELQQQARLQQEIINQQQLSAKAVLAAEERERARIAEDLHDGIGQMMSVARMNLSAIEDELVLTTDKRIKFDKVIGLVDKSCKEVRHISHNMRPVALEKAGIAAAITEFVENIDSRILTLSFYTEGTEKWSDPDIETILFRIIQECVNNVLKHASASNLDISLIKDKDGISVTIDDNGKGFDAKLAVNSEGIGLINIKTRIEYLKGSIEWSSLPGKGTLVVLHVPVQ